MTITGGTAGVLAGTALALTLAAATNQPTAYTAYPDAGWLVEVFGATPGTMQRRHPGGFDVVGARDAPGFPDSVRATALLDGLSDDYPNILIALSPQADETLQTPPSAPTRLCWSRPPTKAYRSKRPPCRIGCCRRSVLTAPAFIR